MPEAVTREITMVVTLTREPTQEEFFRLGRAAAAGLMQEFGTVGYGYRDAADQMATNIRFNQFNFPSVRYANEYSDPRWFVTEGEREDDEDDDDEF